jgi:hemerythrin superfamily protein
MAASLDAIELLIEDHRVIGQLLDQLDEEPDPAKLRLLYLQLVDLLSAHEAAEQQVVFPAFCLALPGAADEAADRLAEHEEVNQLLADMRALSPADLGFDKRASALVLELQNHFLNEEESAFLRLRAALTHEQLLELAERVEVAKRRAPPFPQPAGTDNVHTRRR